MAKVYLCYDARAMPESCSECGLPAVEGTEPDAGPAEAGPPGAAARPAGFWLRAAAVGIDWAFMVAVQVALGLMLRVLWGRAPQGSRVFQAAGVAFEWLFPCVYSVLFHWLFGQTMGKILLRIRVVAVDGGPLTLGIAVRRLLAWVLSLAALGLGHLLAAVRVDKRALHDLLAGTRVERL